MGDIAVRVDPGFAVEARDLQGCQETELGGSIRGSIRSSGRRTRWHCTTAAGLRRPAAALPAKPDVSCETISDVVVADQAIMETILLQLRGPRRRP